MPAVAVNSARTAFPLAINAYTMVMVADLRTEKGLSYLGDKSLYLVSSVQSAEGEEKYSREGNGGSSSNIFVSAWLYFVFHDSRLKIKSRNALSG